MLYVMKKEGICGFVCVSSWSSKQHQSHTNSSHNLCSPANIWSSLCLFVNALVIIFNPFHVGFILCGEVLRTDSKLFQKTAEEGRLEGVTIHHPGSLSAGPCRLWVCTLCVSENVLTTYSIESIKLFGWVWRYTCMWADLMCAEGVFMGQWFIQSTVGPYH